MSAFCIMDRTVFIIHVLRPYQGLWRTKAYISEEQGNKGLKLRGTGTKAILGNMEQTK